MPTIAERNNLPQKSAESQSDRIALLIWHGAGPTPFHSINTGKMERADGYTPEKQMLKIYV